VILDPNSPWAATAFLAPYVVEGQAR
jgi:hypothetical protein